MLVKAGREVLDPLGRRVEVVAVDGEAVKVRLAGPYGATVTYTRSMLRSVEDRKENP